MPNMSAAVIGTSYPPNATAAYFMEHFTRGHESDRDGDPIFISRQVTKLYHVQWGHKLKLACGPSPFAAAPSQVAASISSSSSAPPPPLATCADLLAGRASKFDGIRLVLGITSAPDKHGIKRRQGIRQTWLRWAADRRSGTVACFVVGLKGVKPRERKRLDAEMAQHGDVALLPYVRDGDGPFVTISKLHAWFRLATEQLGLISKGDAEHSDSLRSVLGGGGYASAASRTTIRHIAKVDDDTFLHLPVMQADLDALHCQRHIYYGHFAFAGYNPRIFTKCGFDYSNGGGRYRRYGCAIPQPESGAAHPPFPWTSGALMLASTELVVRIAAEPAVGTFVERSKLRHQELGRVKSTDEDVAMGYYLSRFHLANMARVEYVKINDRLPNLGCQRNGGLYRHPKNRSVGIHFVKTAGGMEYVWSVIHDQAKHNVTRCREATGDGRL